VTDNPYQKLHSLQKSAEPKYEMGILQFLFFLASVRETSSLLLKILLLCAVYECCVYLFLLFNFSRELRLCEFVLVVV
jgi:hypothetical protein